MKLRIYDPARTNIPVYRPQDSGLSPHLSLVIMGRLHKRALGTACGMVLGALVFVLTATSLIVPGIPEYPLSLLDNFFPGYSVTWSGAVAGLLSAGFMGFVFGWFAAFCRNLVLAVWLLYVRARAQIAATQDFLDHI